MSASTEYSWLEFGFPEDPDKDCEAAQHCMLSNPPAGSEFCFQTCPKLPWLLFVVQMVSLSAGSWLQVDHLFGNLLEITPVYVKPASVL